jgi:hypothetical protein
VLQIHRDLTVGSLLTSFFVGYQLLHVIIFPLTIPKFQINVPKKVVPINVLVVDFLNFYFGFIYHKFVFVFTQVQL